MLWIQIFVICFKYLLPLYCLPFNSLSGLFWWTEVFNSNEVQHHFSFAFTPSHFSHVRLCNTVDCSSPGSSVHGILQARILEWLAMPSSRGSSWSRDWTCISCGSCIAVRFFIKETPGKSHFSCMITFFLFFFKHLSLSRDSILSYRSFVFCPWHLDLQSTAWNSFGDRMCDGAISIFFSFFSLIMLFSHLLVPTCSLFFHSAYRVHTFLPNFACLSDHQLFRLYPSITI